MCVLCVCMDSSCCLCAITYCSLMSWTSVVKLNLLFGSDLPCMECAACCISWTIFSFCSRSSFVMLQLSFLSLSFSMLHRASFMMLSLKMSLPSPVFPLSRPSSLLLTFSFTAVRSFQVVSQVANVAEDRYHRLRARHCHE